MKHTVRILCIVLMAILVCVGLAACEHKEAADHTATGEWLSDETHHWHACEKEKCADAGDRAEHVYDNACDAECNICAYKRAAAAHAYDNACDTACNVCGATREITHVYDKTVANSDYLKAAATATTKAQYWKSCACGAKSDTEYFESDKTAGTLANIQDLSKTYNAVALANPTYETNSDGAVTVEWYQGTTKLPAAPVNAGTYKVKVIIAESAAYTGVSAEREIVISKKAATFTTAPAMSAVTIKYTENYFVNYMTDGDGAVTVEYKVRGAADNTYSAAVPLNKGLYTARVSVAEGANYTAVSATVDYEIEAFVFSGLSTNVSYNGTNTHNIDLTPNGHSGVTLRVTFGDNGDVGANPTGVVVLENGQPTENYLVDVGSCTVTIVAKTVSVTWTAPASLRFDGTEKAPTAALTGVLDGDDCTVQISRKDGDNVWFGETFTYEAMMLDGADAGNYALPSNGNTCTSPTYAITIDSMTVSTPSYIADGVYYQKIVIETAGYYYFDFVPATQGVEITFTIYEKGASYTTIPVFTVGDQDKQSAAFELEAGTYYVKSVTDDEPQYDTLTIAVDTHATADEYGFCDKGCGTYVGEELDTNSLTTVTIPRGQTAYYRFEDGGDVSYNFSYHNSDGTNLTVKCYRAVNAEGDFEELTGFGLLPHEFVTSYDGYYYLIIKHNTAIGGSNEKTIIFQVEETT